MFFFYVHTEMDGNRMAEIIRTPEQYRVPEPIQFFVVRFPFTLQPVVEKKANGLVFPDFSVKSINQQVNIFQILNVSHLGHLV